MKNKDLEFFEDILEEGLVDFFYISLGMYVERESTPLCRFFHGRQLIFECSKRHCWSKAQWKEEEWHFTQKETAEKGFAGCSK